MVRTVLSAQVEFMRKYVVYIVCIKMFENKEIPNLTGKHIFLGQNFSELISFYAVIMIISMYILRPCSIFRSYIYFRKSMQKINNNVEKKKLNIERGFLQ